MSHKINSAIIHYIITTTLICSCGTTSNINNATSFEYQYFGILERHSYTCSVPGPSHRHLYVYLPEAYYDSNISYPVLYLLHGANGNETSWIKKGRILECIDSLTRINEIEKAIYVFPNTNHYYNDYDYGNSREKKSIDAFFGLNGSVEHSFLNDVVGYIDSHFRTMRDKRHRAIAGLSLGGLQTIYISSNYSDYFDYIGLFSPLIYPPSKFGEFTYIYKGLEDKLYKQFFSSPSMYWIMVGEDDFYFNSSYFYSKLLEINQYPHLFYISDGGHTWTNWRAYCMMFMKNLWQP